MAFTGPPNSINKQLSKDNSLFECILSIQIKKKKKKKKRKKKANVVKPHDDISFCAYMRYSKSDGSQLPVESCKF